LADEELGQREEITYQYDSLQRLISAVTTGPEWGLSFSYDGFGNRLTQAVTKGTAPVSSVNVDAATNRVIGAAYDANGNALSGSYDGLNRMAASGEEQYSYGPDNRRVWRRKQSGAQEVYFWSVAGQRMGTYPLQLSGGVLSWGAASVNVHFGGKLVRSAGKTVAVDRLGSVVGRGGPGAVETHSYFPYGEERVVTAQDREKFGTYLRDATGLDYADQRYYASTQGRFTSPDPYQASGGAGEPGSWNRYGYVEGDPVN